MSNLTVQQKAIIDAAISKGTPISEAASELLAYDLLQSCVAAIAKQDKPFKSLTQQQQENVIEQIREQIKTSVDVAAAVMASHAAKAVRVKLGAVALGKSIKLTTTIDSNEPHTHELFDRVSEQADAVLVLYPADYYQGIDSVKGEADQKPLELDKAAKAPAKAPAKKAAEAAAAKPIEITPAQLEAAREFVTKQQNGTVAGLQNQLKCNDQRALAIHKVLADEGLLGGTINDRLDRELIREKKAEAAPKEEPEAKPESTEPKEASFVNVRAFVVESGQYNKSAISKEFGITPSDASLFIAQLEKAGIISPEDEIGKRQVLVKE